MPIPIPPTPLPCCTHTITKAGEQLIISTASGQRITLQQSSASVLIEDGNGNTIRLDTTGVTVTCSAKVVIAASQVEISAGMVTVDAGMAKFSGIIQTDTLIANSVVSASYSPGKGNIW
jgi:phage baseplate assembly protein gpV